MVKWFSGVDWKTGTNLALMNKAVSCETGWSIFLMTADALFRDPDLDWSPTRGGGSPGSGNCEADQAHTENAFPKKDWDKRGAIRLKIRLLRPKKLQSADDLFWRFIANSCKL